MSSILVLEPEPRTLERIHGALVAEGWRVRTVQEPSQILQAAASEAPDLVILDATLAGVDVVVRSLSRGAGGPGVLGLVPAGSPAAGAFASDELLEKPFEDQALRERVRRAVAARRPALSMPSPAAADSKLTSHDIFGDVLAEVEGLPATPPNAVPRPAPPRPAPAAATPPRPLPPSPVAPRPAAPRPAGDVHRRLEETLSGVLGTAARPRPAGPPPAPRPPQTAPSPPRPAPPPRRAELNDDDIDAILSRTLSSLEGGAPRPRPAAPAPPAPPSAAPRPAAAAPAPEGTAARRAVRPVDAGLAELEEMAREARKPDGGAAVRETTRSGVTAAPPAAPAAAPPGHEVPRLGTAPGEPGLKPHSWGAVASPATSSPGGAPPPQPPAEPMFSFFEEPPELPELAEPAVPAVAAPPSAPPPAAAAPEPPPAPAAPPAPPVRVTEDIATTQRIPVFSGEETLGEQAGERFGQYTLLEKIAAGGMAEVWKARMRGVEGFQKTVAIKKILSHMTDNSEFIGMFIDEAKLAAQLGHPNIVHIYDLGKIGRDYYIAMEYVEGKDLRSLLNAAWRKGVRMPLGIALLIGSRLASALDYAHRKRDFEGRELGLVHRDVSPQNVLISYEGDIKLCDFGIAKAVSKAGQTQMGALKGKLQYMSPEQAWGRPIDARSDIFSLGAVLFEMLTGERLFSGDSELSVLESVRQGRVRRLREIDPSLPTAVEVLVSRALAYEPSDRFANAGEMMQRLEDALHILQPSPGPTDLALWMRRVLEAETEVEAEAEPGPLFFTPKPAAAATAPGPLPPADLFAAPAAEGAVEAVAPLGEVLVEEGGGKRSRMLLYAAIVILVLAVAATLFLLNRPRNGAGGETAPGPGSAPGAMSTPAPAPPTAPPVAPTAPQANPGAAGPVDMSGIVNEELARRNEALRNKYEAEEKRLQQELAARKAAGGAQPPPAAAPARVPPPQETPAPAAVAPPVPEPTPAPVQETPRPAVQSEPEPARQQAPPPEPEPAARVRTGDLVAGGPGVVSPQLVSAPKPEYPPVARTLRVEGIVVVSVLVDENGQVQDVRLIEPIRQKVGINEAAVAAARSARYRPATKDGVRVKMWTRLRIPFKL